MFYLPQRFSLKDKFQTGEGGILQNTGGLAEMKMGIKVQGSSDVRKWDRVLEKGVLHIRRVPGICIAVLLSCWEALGHACTV